MPKQEAVRVSGPATKTLSTRMRQWSGWGDATLLLGDPSPVSPHASCNHRTRTFTVNPDTLILNPNRVLNSVTPFRLRQEAVLTGAMLHEAGHARYSHWIPRDDLANRKHYDGEPVQPQTVAFARLFEEARVEGQVAVDADRIGATGLEWTMKASAAHLIPMTKVPSDPDEALMSVVTSWALRAGRAYAFAMATGTDCPAWVSRFDSFLHDQLINHGLNWADTDMAMLLMRRMTTSASHTGTYMIDKARDVLRLLFPETDAPMAPDVCAGGESGSEQDGDEQDGDDRDDDLAAATEMLASLEDTATAEEGDAAQREVYHDSAGGLPTQTPLGGGWQHPGKDDREVAKAAGDFLRRLVSPSETLEETLTDTPSARVDGAQLAAWKASGGSRDPRFFVRSARQTEPVPPVRIAVLVDISLSMETMQRPSALLSWALASAALDLRNFAGRGQQVESCLIHWGTSANVVQGVGDTLPGLREVPCVDMTYAWADAARLVEEQMPGFFHLSEKPENRLIINFTDWELGQGTEYSASPWFNKAMAAGVTMLSIVPPYQNSLRPDYREHDASKLPRLLEPDASKLPWLLEQVPVMNGSSHIIQYTEGQDRALWDEAARALRG